MKYAGVVRVKQVKVAPNGGDFEEIIAEFLGSADKCQDKPKTFVHWVAAHEAAEAEIRLYSSLFKVENVNELPNFLDGIDRDSLVVHRNAKINKNLLGKIITHSAFKVVAFTADFSLKELAILLSTRTLISRISATFLIG